MRTTPSCQYQTIFADDSLLAVVKPAGMPVQPDPTGDPDLLSALEAEWGHVWLVHRLDRMVGGVMVFARTAAAAASLSKQVQLHDTFEKWYAALVPGEICGEKTLSDLLFHDTRAHRAFVVDRMRAGVKEAHLIRRGRSVRETACGTVTLLQIRLLTGRFHQIRVQLASRATPILGDGKYGSRVKCPLALFAYRIALLHPVTGRRLVFSAQPASCRPWDVFESDLNAMQEE